MSSLNIRGVPVEFPFKPYKLQEDYMEKVIECLQNETNGVLESPTGTGKTLSLLCSSLAWLSVKKAQIQAQRQKSAMCNDENEFMNSLHANLLKTAGKVASGRAFLGLPSIIYASRTHSQLSQAMQELKRTAYSHMKATVLGSREQMCIHPEVIKEPSSSLKVQMCRIKTKIKACHFFNRVERKKDDPAIANLSVVDIEDMVKLGEAHKFCPYYMAKELKQHADIIFMPYNYLLDARFRKALGVELANNVIILDEAHNVEKICEDSASLEIINSDITLAIEEVTEVMKAMTEVPDSFMDDDVPKDFTADELCVLKQMLLDFEKALDEVPLAKDDSDITSFEGNYIFELFGKANINDGNYNMVISLMDKIVQFLASVADGPFARRGIGLQLLEDLLLIAFASTSSSFKEKINKCYKVRIKLEEPKKKQKDNWLSKATAKPAGRILSYWCFSPGFGMNMLMDQNMRSVILTSGTLAPLKPLICELELNVQVRLENPHIVTDEQIFVRIITRGPDNETLNSNYQNRDNPNYMSSLGRTILNLTRIIPNGLLIFFPSYPLMQNIQQHWQKTGIWSSICEQKPVYVEPKDKVSFNNAMTEYYKKIQDPNLKGAIFMGVCRGKVSEGLDFADSNGRAVIITGLPYPPLKDPKVVLKKRYLDVCNAKDKEYLRGNEWYSLEAYRAVNQAIGRVIRHKNDYGAILLLDCRFNNQQVRSQLSRWLREHVNVVNNFGEIMKDLRAFFKNADAKFSSKNEKPQPNTKPAEFCGPQSYKKGNFHFTNNAAAYPGCSTESSELDAIQKRSLMEMDGNVKKRKKIILISNASIPNQDFSKTTATEYIMMVKSALDSDTFKKFTLALALYKDNNSFSDLRNSLDDIIAKKFNMRHLLSGLEPYIKSEHKDDFAVYRSKM